MPVGGGGGTVGGDWIVAVAPGLVCPTAPAVTITTVAVGLGSSAVRVNMASATIASAATTNAAATAASSHHGM